MITLAQAKWHLRIDGTDHDTELAQLIVMAEAIVGQHLGKLRAREDETPEALAIADAARLQGDAIDAAVLLVVGELFANREAGTANPLSPGVRLLLDSMRSPTYG